MKDLKQKRLDQKKETWIKNVMRIENLSREIVEQMYLTIKPYRNESI